MNHFGQFIIRVYGIVLNEKDEVLLTDEFQLGMKMTKFPGGGLNYGEGTIDCLKREFREECNGQKIENIRHFYTTGFFQEALFYAHHQLISIYYLADLQMPLRVKKMENGNQSFRWVKLKDLKTDDLSFPIDKFVAKELKKRFK